MKTYLLLILLSVSAVACKSKKSASASASTVAAPVVVAGETVGKVSHKYRSGGCTTVILVAQEGGEDMVLIPKDKLSKEFDVDGLEIRFNYLTLKMPQPAGCSTGMPASISDISKK